MVVPLLTGGHFPHCSFYRVVVWVKGVCSAILTASRFADVDANKLLWYMMKDAFSYIDSLDLSLALLLVVGILSSVTVVLRGQSSERRFLPFHRLQRPSEQTKSIMLPPLFCELKFVPEPPEIRLNEDTQANQDRRIFRPMPWFVPVVKYLWFSFKVSRKDDTFLNLRRQYH